MWTDATPAASASRQEDVLGSIPPERIPRERMSRIPDSPMLAHNDAVFIPDCREHRSDRSENAQRVPEAQAAAIWSALTL